MLAPVCTTACACGERCGVVVLQVRRCTHQLYWYHGCHPAKMYLLPWIQLPLWLTLSLALRNMSGAWPGTPPDRRHAHTHTHHVLY